MGERRRSQPVEIIEILTDQRVVVRSQPAVSNDVRMRPAMVALIAIAALVVVAVAARSLLATSPRAALKPPATTAPARVPFTPTPTPALVPTDATLPVVTVPTGGVCSDDRLPFLPSFLPSGWTANGSVWSGPDLLTGGNGTVRAIHGPAIPTHGDPVSSLTVLGVPASIAPVADGYSVEFVLGAPSDRCDHWALVASKGVAAATLQRIAEALTAFAPRTATLECQRAYPQAEPDLAGRTLAFDAVALPTSVQLDTVAAHLPNGTLALFAREILQVRAGEAFSLSVAPTWAGQVAMDWQGGVGPVSSVIVPACGANTPWLSFFGGFWVFEPQCVTLLVDAAGKEREVRVGIGVACP
jgi:hypothetical protein